MESKADVKRRLILDTTKQIILENGFNSLTLDAVAKKANISKGGLLYHFSNKESLIKGLAQYIFEQFCLNFYKYAENDSDDSDEKGKWSRALIEASKFDLEHYKELNVGIFATSYLEPEIAKTISDGYKTTLKKLEDDGINPITATIIRLALDGLYYSQTLNVAPLEEKRVNEVIQQLLEMSKSEERL
ncbi:TetR/AcrR family transcriptional regulator [Lentibacillus sp. Marseille-P4043]|uniref:TetR/AcrR family transcriptional regulator n=1 Tax=Lentibacillus sp. Marseille-P4043 TaxID=2040293 RepID=UPI000D0AE515|nr:TetR/AcrR family transcriptional regulator [Lentibacillus sp. Marseille-P4043]